MGKLPMDKRVADISVEPVSGGWMVKATFNQQALVFKSGARAEGAARNLAQAAVKAGLLVRFQVQDRDGTVVSSTRHDGAMPSRDFI